VPCKPHLYPHIIPPKPIRSASALFLLVGFGLSFGGMSAFALFLLVGFCLSCGGMSAFAPFLLVGFCLSFGGMTSGSTWAPGAPASTR